MLKLIPRPLQKKIFTLYSLLTRSMTFGVRGIVVDDEQRVLLVRHTYVDGWFLPGGGVERGETMSNSMVKEMMEEAHVRIVNPRLFHIYRNPTASRFDHVALFICENWKDEGGWETNNEIAEIGFFKISSLPEETTDNTRQRLNEVFNGRTVSDIW